METLRSGLDEYVSSWAGPTEATGQPSRSRACCYLVWRTLARYRKQGLRAGDCGQVHSFVAARWGGAGSRRRLSASRRVTVRRIPASNHRTVNIERSTRRRSG